uniref:Uncharacterized protein n=1 Tax=Arundo donax TaxID=35708 RepID=A0A0A9HDG1_ARUDO
MGSGEHKQRPSSLYDTEFNTSVTMADITICDLQNTL